MTNETNNGLLLNNPILNIDFSYQDYNNIINPSPNISNKSEESYYDVPRSTSYKTKINNNIYCNMNSLHENKIKFVKDNSMDDLYSKIDKKNMQTIHQMKMIWIV
ncbi:hypothetical protein MYSEV_226 [Mythimna separata entomopoxvirus 'L']|uniref:Uncharacterized protein n=1 Tax=Mythimna separata entomopoxvirus 'L' TaxID=1293572 RepID=A0A916NYR2_9POXV|nr:hypothetical protein MYSEV_226 [Mythimna separata entomopoxvirus 'L']CCU56424.1 hypothetical protein MYSEV_226 [Mythimna separata entomopoxvirus 'L']